MTTFDKDTYLATGSSVSLLPDGSLLVTFEIPARDRKTGMIGVADSPQFLLDRGTAEAFARKILQSIAMAEAGPEARKN